MESMTAEQLEELLAELEDHHEFITIKVRDAVMFSRRMFAADKLVVAIYDDASDQWWYNVHKAALAYREASK